MLSNTTLKNTLDGIKAIAGIDLYLFDTDGASICSTEQADESRLRAKRENCGGQKAVGKQQAETI